MNNAQKILDGKVCLITGGAGLLGQSFSRAIAMAGGTLVLVDVNKERGKDVAETLVKETENNQIVFEYCDITNEHEVEQLVSRIAKQYGKIDALINNAYPRNKNYGKKFEEVTYHDFCENVNMHLGGYFLMSQKVAVVMMKQKYGNIINMGSIYGFAAPRFEVYDGTTMTMPVEYAAIKGGLLNVTTYLASYLGKYHIRVNMVSPGGVSDKQPESFVKKYNEKVLLGGRMATPDDISGAIMFLLSDASHYMTGQNITVDGGWSL